MTTDNVRSHNIGGQSVARVRAATSPLRAFLVTESGSAGVMAAAIVVAIAWANIDSHSYEAVWHSVLSITLGGHGVAQDLRTWVNSGLMSLFFLVSGLEARREFDVGELRDRQRVLLPISVGVLAMIVPAALFLIVNAGGAGVRGWGTAMSTDTALALGALSLVGRNLPDRVRIFLLTMFIADDLVSLVVIAVGYGGTLRLVPMLVAVGIFVVMVAILRWGIDQPALYAVLGVAIWITLLFSGVDPVVAGLAIGLAASAYSPHRENLERATRLVRRFREQPTAELARDAASGLTSTLSPNARLQRFYHPWTRYLVVPLFGLANAGVPVNGQFLAHAFTSPITIGIIVGYVVGKPLAIVGGSALLTWLTKGRIRPPVGWAAVVASGAVGGAGFTVSFLIASRAFTGTTLDEVKVGVLSAAVLASLLAWLTIRGTRLLPRARRVRAIVGNLEQLVDLVEPVDESKDHVRGPLNASVTVVEYGDFECPYCGLAETSIRADLALDDDVRYVWRHLPLTDVHPRAELAAEASEAAAEQDAFWAMHDLLLANQNKLTPQDLLRYAGECGLDIPRFSDDLKRHVYAPRVASDVESADASDVAGTPTFFINGRRHHGAYDIGTLAKAIRFARDHSVARGATERVPDLGS
jgi:Na+/H+ antiporter NhaA